MPILHWKLKLVLVLLLILALSPAIAVARTICDGDTLVKEANITISNSNHTIQYRKTCDFGCSSNHFFSEESQCNPSPTTRQSYFIIIIAAVIAVAVILFSKRRNF